jgi:hypothetical protein
MSEIPLWFLIGSLFLPRVCLFFSWLGDWWLVVSQPWSALLWIFLPRVLVMILIHAHQGFSVWFWVHLVVALLVWGSSTSGASRRHD